MALAGVSNGLILAAGCIVLPVSIYIETLVRLEFMLLNLKSIVSGQDMESADNWNYGDWKLKLKRFLSILGGWVGAVLFAESFRDSITIWGSAVMFGTLLYVKNWVSLRRAKAHLEAIVHSSPEQ